MTPNAVERFSQIATGHLKALTDQSQRHDAEISLVGETEFRLDRLHDEARQLLEET